MSEEAAGVDVTALLVCREVQSSKTGVSLREIVEIVPVLQFPGEAGPLTFAAFVRASRPGEAQVAFRVHPMGDPATTLVELPGRLSVAKGYEGRQSVIAAGFKTLKVNAGGWFGVEFRVGGKVLAHTKFLVGAISRAQAGGPPAPAAGTTS